MRWAWGRASAGSSWAWERSVNQIRLTVAVVGQPSERENRCAAWAEWILQRTWGSPNLVLGYAASTFYNVTGASVYVGGRSRPDPEHPIPTGYVLAHGGAIGDLLLPFALPPYILSHSEETGSSLSGYRHRDWQGRPVDNQIQVWMHEGLGHGAQSALYGPFYGPVALLSGTGRDPFNWFDNQADRMAGLEYHFLSPRPMWPDQAPPCPQEETECEIIVPVPEEQQSPKSGATFRDIFPDYAW